MSFMFNPYPYDDPNAFNVLDPSGLPLSELVEGSGASAAAEAAKAAGALKRAEGWVIAVDGYSTAPLDTFRNLLEQQLALLGIPVTVMAVEELWRRKRLFPSGWRLKIFRRIWKRIRCSYTESCSQAVMRICGT